MSEKIKSVFDGVPWARLFIEGGVIVSSILLAFAIDAWWEQRQDRQHEMSQLVRVSAELRQNQSMLLTKVDNLQTAFDAAVQLQSWMGVTPETVKTDLFNDTWDRMFDIGTFSLVNRAIDEHLATGSQDDAALMEIRSQLSNWSYRSKRLGNQYDILRREHQALIYHLVRNEDAPILGSLPAWMKQYGIPETAFPFDQASVLGDPVTESLLASYMMRLMGVINQSKQHAERQQALVERIENTVPE